VFIIQFSVFIGVNQFSGSAVDFRMYAMSGPAGPLMED